MSDDRAGNVLAEKAGTVTDREGFVDFVWDLASRVHESPEEWGCSTVDDFLSKLSTAIVSLGPVRDERSQADEPTWGHLAQLFLAALRK